MNYNASSATTDDSSDSSDSSSESSDSDDGANTDAEASANNGSNNSEKVWNYFKAKGFSDASIAGILGNMYQESGVNPKSIQGNGKGPAAGIFQWENYNTKSARWANLKKFADKKKADWKDLQVQLDYASKEMPDQNHYFTLDQDIHDIDGKDYHTDGLKGGFKDYTKMTDVKDATIRFEAAFERAGKPNIKRRVDYANKMMKQYGGKGGDDEDNEYSSFINNIQDISGAGEGDAKYLNSLTRNFNLEVQKRASGFKSNRKNATDVSTLE